MLSNQQGGQADVESAVEYSTIDLEWIIIELVHLLDRDFPSGSTLVKEVLSLACESKRTLLHLSAALGFHELLGEIIQHEVDLNQPDICGCTALHYAALYGHLAGATLLIYGGANAEVTDRWGRLAAELAADSDHHDIEEMLNAWQPGISSLIMDSSSITATAANTSGHFGSSVPSSSSSSSPHQHQHQQQQGQVRSIPTIMFYFPTNTSIQM